MLASLGKLQAAPIRFEAVSDVPEGGVLCVWPALLALVITHILYAPDLAGLMGDRTT